MAARRTVFSGRIVIEIDEIGGRPALFVTVPSDDEDRRPLLLDKGPGTLELLEHRRDGDRDVFAIEYLEGGQLLEDVMRRHGETVGRWAGAPCDGCGAPLDARITGDGAQLLCHRCGAMFAPDAIEPVGLDGAWLGSPMPLAVAASIGGQIARLLGGCRPGPWLASLSKLHVAPGGQLRLVDAGVADAIRALAYDPERRLHLTRRFRQMSPALARARPIQPNDASYSLGLLLYELTCGRHPCDPWTTDLDFLERIVASEFAAPGAGIADYPERLARLIARALSLEPDDRPTLADIETELAAIAAPDPAPIARYLGALCPPRENYAMWPLWYT